jgi:anthranilate 1,2-dioxygenase small subunit
MTIDAMNDRSAIAAALADASEDYAAAIDLDELERWPDFFETDCTYKVTTRDNVQAGWPIGVIYADSRAALQDRVKSLREANVYEGQVYRHVMGRPRIIEVDGDLVRAETSFLVVRTMRDGEMLLFAAGSYHDLVRLEAGKMSFVERIVVCDSSRVDTLMALPL